MPVKELLAVSDSSAREIDFSRFRNRSAMPAVKSRWMATLLPCASSLSADSQLDDLADSCHIIKMVRHIDDVYLDLQFSQDTAELAEQYLPPMQPMDGYSRASQR